MVAKKDPKAVARGRQALSERERLDVVEREEAVMALRIKGTSFAKINRELGITNSARVFSRAMQREMVNTPYIRAEAVRVEAERLDALQEGIWDRATKGHDPRAVEVALQVLKRRADLFGLDFAHLVNARAVEIEEAKVQMMAVALQAALDAIGLSAEQKQLASGVFLQALRTSENPWEQ